MDRLRRGPHACTLACRDPAHVLPPPTMCSPTTACMHAQVLYPNAMYLSRGNHESKNMNKIYGFEGEVRRAWLLLLASTCVQFWVIGRPKVG